MPKKSILERMSFGDSFWISIYKDASKIGKSLIAGFLVFATVLLLFGSLSEILKLIAN